MERFAREEDLKYVTIAGGLAWPSQRQAFIVVVGREKEFPHAVKVLAEAEASDVRETVRTAAAWDTYYACDWWTGETENRSAQQFIREANREARLAHAPGHDFRLRRSNLLDLREHFVSYAYPRLRGLMSEARLTVPEGKLRSYLLEVQGADLANLKIDDFPAVTALALVALGLEGRQDSGPRATYAKNDYNHL